MVKLSYFPKTSARAINYYLLLLVLILFCQCSSGGELVEITFARSEDDSEFIPEMIKEFNKDHRGEIQVNYVPMARHSDEMYHQIKNDFAERKSATAQQCFCLRIKQIMISRDDMQGKQSKSVDDK